MTSIATGMLWQLVRQSTVPASISNGEIALLRRLIAEEAKNDGEQLTRFVPGGWWLDTDRLSSTLCFRLIRHCFISMDGEESGGVSYWHVNDMGRMAVDGLAYADILAAVR